MEQKMFNIIEYDEFNELAGKYIPGYNVAAELEASNGASYQVTGVKGEYELEYDYELDKELDTPDKYPSNMLEYMVHKGDLPAGDYLIEVSW